VGTRLSADEIGATPALLDAGLFVVTTEAVRSRRRGAVTSIAMNTLPNDAASRVSAVISALERDGVIHDGNVVADAAGI
ncbi:MAG: hypothetical protein AAGK78_05245, partial [Planctomycetota bacterium]